MYDIECIHTKLSPLGVYDNDRHTYLPASTKYGDFSCTGIATADSRKDGEAANE